MAWLIYVRGLSGPCPQIVFDGGDKPFIGDGIRGLVLPGSERRITDAEVALGVTELARRYPAPVTAGEVA